MDKNERTTVDSLRKMESTGRAGESRKGEKRNRHTQKSQDRVRTRGSWLERKSEENLERENERWFTD